MKGINLNLVVPLKVMPDSEIIEVRLAPITQRLILEP